jgi:hypothetical protein
MRHLYNFLPVCLLILLLSLIVGQATAQNPKNKTSNTRMLAVNIKDGETVVKVKTDSACAVKVFSEALEPGVLDSILKQMHCAVFGDTNSHGEFLGGGNTGLIKMFADSMDMEGEPNAMFFEKSGCHKKTMAFSAKGGENVAFYTSTGPCNMGSSLEFLNDSVKKYLWTVNKSINMDSVMHLDFDLIVDPINQADSLIEMMEAHHKKVKIIKTGNEDMDIIFISDNGEEIKIERNGEVIFMKKDGQVKDVWSNIEVETNAEGDKVIVLKTKIELDEMSSDEKSDLSKNGIQVGKKELELEYLRFYPNPSDGDVNVELKLNEPGNAKLKVVSMLGKVVYEQVIENANGVYHQAIDIKKYGTGTYFLQVQQGRKSVTRKVIVE